MSQKPDFLSRVWAVGATAHDCYPKHIAPDPYAPSCGWWAYGKVGPRLFFGLCPAESRRQRFGHQALTCVPQPQAWLQGGAPAHMERKSSMAKKPRRTHCSTWRLCSMQANTNVEDSSYTPAMCSLLPTVTIVIRGNPVSVVLGSHNIDWKMNRLRRYLVESVYIYPSYRIPVLGSDIMLLKGDSGGPLVCNGVAVGIVSFNRENICQYPDVPNVYTEISAYADWIKKVIEADR
ncbi:hypothetical protein QTP70_023431 [Hemibagrus guttatus]|uniref:Peptidase S1 domain-containing protein n=1 Tax=Hemibagrus guttatus TaxID=175788 RepID=A0AAE0V2Z0_9TELE|nr:hypothetical protein QTP70_023431 [Hemibagrus guttatus]